MSAPTFVHNVFFMPTIDGSLCCNCGRCYRVCETGALEAVRRADGDGEQASQVESYLCVNCRKCVEECDRKAIRIAARFSRASSIFRGRS